MKIKTDFVTNSSSTCYVLTSVVSGVLPLLSRSYERLKAFYEDQTFIYNDYLHLVINEDEDNEYAPPYPDGETYQLEFSLLDSKIYKGTEAIPATLLNMKLNNFNPYEIDQTKMVTDFIEKILFEQLNEKIKTAQLSYLCYPSSITGDGWDGGDDSSGPNHKYEYKYQVYEGENKLGIFSIVNSNIIAEIGGIKDQMEFNQMALDQMNTTGFGLEEQNDKNS